MRSPSAALNGHATHSTAKFQPLFADSSVDRREFVRLTLQALNEAGLHHTAAKLTEEAGIEAESVHISAFRQAVLQGHWTEVDRLLRTIDSDYDRHEAEYRFLISRQHYLEVLESKQSRKALSILRNELVPARRGTEQLHALSSLMMCTDPADLRSRASWSGSEGDSRLKLLVDLQVNLSSHVMLPEHRLETLLQQARSHQCSICPYHVASTSSTPFSLLADHTCARAAFPNHCTHILTAHHDEVWTLAFSHDGKYLATAGKDRTVIIWSVHDDFEHLHTLSGHTDGIFCLAWSPDDSVLLTSAELSIKMWDPKMGKCVKTLSEHAYTVSALAWMPDGRSFVSAGMDAKLYFWDMDGNVKYTWRTGPYRIVDAAISPDGSRLVAVGKAEVPMSSDIHPDSSSNGRQPYLMRTERRLHVFDIAQQKQIASITQPRDLTCVSISDDSSYALVNETPDEIRLYNLEDASLVRRFKGHQQGEHILKSCFGGRFQNFVVTGSEDSKIYVWHRETGALIEALAGHSTGSVNQVGWNSAHSAMFASVGDDQTVRIWQPKSAAGPSTNGHASS